MLLEGTGEIEPILQEKPDIPHLNKLIEHIAARK